MFTQFKQDFWQGAASSKRWSQLARALEAMSSYHGSASKLGMTEKDTLEHEPQ